MDDDIYMSGLFGIFGLTLLRLTTDSILYRLNISTKLYNISEAHAIEDIINSTSYITVCL